MDHRNVLLGELTRKELGAAVQSGAVRAAIVPTGATEPVSYTHLTLPTQA